MILVQSQFLGVVVDGCMTVLPVVMYVRNFITPLYDGFFCWYVFSVLIFSSSLERMFSN